jgi:cytochrome c-type biogenesis protein CcmH
VTPEAEAVFQRVLTVDPTNEPARLYVALGMRARGDDAGAAAALLALLADEPAGGADWADFARAELADMGVEAPPAPAPIAEPGTAPTTVLEALGGTPAEALASPMAAFTPEQAAAINEMVNGLALRLLETPNDPPGWAQLITSYIVLGRIEDAEAALAMARQVLAGNAEGLALVEEAAAPLRETE